MAAKATNASSVTTAFLLELNRAGRNNTFTLQIIKQGGQDFLVKEGGPLSLPAALSQFMRYWALKNPPNRRVF